MNISLMIDALVGELKIATSQLQLETKKGDFKTPDVYDGYLPKPNPKDTDEKILPYVIVRYVSDETDDDSSSAVVKIICCIYSEDDQRGWRDLINLTDAIKTHLLSKRFFGGCFKVISPIKRQMPDEQPMSAWNGELTVSVEMPNVMEVNDDVTRILNG